MLSCGHRLKQTEEEPVTAGAACMHCSHKVLIVLTWPVTADFCSFLGWTSTHFEVVWDEELGRPEEVEDVAEHVSIPVNEVVLLQAVQDYGLRTIKETANSTRREGRGGGLGRKRGIELGGRDNMSILKSLFFFGKVL